MKESVSDGKDLAGRHGLVGEQGWRGGREAEGARVCEVRKSKGCMGRDTHAYNFVKKVA